MLDGRKIIEVSWRIGRADCVMYDARVWLVHAPGGRHVCQAVEGIGEPHWWLAVGPFGSDGAFPTLRDVRRHFFRGNGRAVGGHAEITHYVPGRMSRVNVLALAMIRAVPGHGDY